MPNAAKWVEITTKIGCLNNCLYCPQELLLKTYFKDNKNRQVYMTYDDFKKIISHLNKDMHILFAGMGEPFENPETIKMIKYAHNKNFKISVYTSLRGLSINAIKEIEHIPFSDFIIHTPDQDRLLKLNVDDEYIKKINYLKNSKILNKQFIVIGNPDENIIKNIDKDLKKWKIILRGNNIDKANIPSNIEFQQQFIPSINDSTPVICSRILNDTRAISPTKLKNSIILPDGTVLLCCMDYGLEHILGNIYTQSFEDIMRSSSMIEIENSMLCKNNRKILCRHCEWAIQYDQSKWSTFIKYGFYEQEIPIFMASDDKNSPVLAIAMQSIISNTKSFVHFYILDGGISILNKQKIKSLKKHFKNFDIEFLKIDKKKIKNFYTGHLTINTYFRYFISNIKPNIQKLLYLDTDIIVTSDIKELFNIDIENYIIGAVPRHCEQLKDKNIIEQAKKMNIDINSYFNAGVLLINNKKWREENITSRCISLTKKLNNKLINADQDVLNIIFENNYKKLEYGFNALCYFNEYLINKGVLKENECKILHYAGLKPWTQKTYQDSYFWKFVNLSPYKRFFTKKISKKNSIIQNIFSIRNNNNHKVIVVCGIKIKFKKR